MRRQLSPKNGFTLIELILVMTIIAIVVAAVAPSLRGFGVGRKNKDLATLMVSLSNYARTQAITDARTYRLHFDAPTRAFWLTAERGGAFQPVPNDFGKRFEAADSVQMRTDLTAWQDGTYVQFRPDGRTDPARIWLTDKLGTTVEVACDSATEQFHIVPTQEMTQ